MTNTRLEWIAFGRGVPSPQWWVGGWVCPHLHATCASISSSPLLSLGFRRPLAAKTLAGSSGGDHWTSCQSPITAFSRYLHSPGSHQSSRLLEWVSDSASEWVSQIASISSHGMTLQIHPILSLQPSLNTMEMFFRPVLFVLLHCSKQYFLWLDNRPPNLPRELPLSVQCSNFLILWRKLHFNTSCENLLRKLKFASWTHQTINGKK